MGQFVGHDIGDQLLLVLCARCRVDEQQALAERDAAEVFHGAGSEVGEPGQVDLVAGVGDSVVLLEPAEAERTDVQTELGEVILARYVHDAHRRTIDVHRIAHFESADDEGDEVGAHDHRVGESNHDSTVGSGPIDFGSVGDRLQAVGDVERDTEHGLELGLVPTGKGPAAISGLHLRGRDNLIDSSSVGVGAAVEATEFVVEDATEFDDERARPGVNLVVGVDEQALRLLLEREVSGCTVDGA